MGVQADAKVYVVGHEWALDLLNRQQAAGRAPQALLLTGPPNVGKSTVARFWAQQLNCQQISPPCGQCSSCRKIVSGNHPDVRIFDSDDQALKIDDIRNLQRELSLSPNEGRYRVVVLANFERATLSAANALLKTLEEPASQAILVLTATDPGALLPTIVSRCQLLALRPLPHERVVKALREHWQAKPEQAELLAQLAAGRLGWAVKALNDTELLNRREQHLQELISLLQAGRAERLAYAHQLSRDGAMLREVLTLWLTIWRDLLLLQSGAAQTKIMNLNWQEQLQQLAGHSSLAEASQMVARLRTALINLERNVNPRLSLEVLLLKLPKLREV
ncbi:MAG: DNA polymerase III subunit delta' [Anaerolineae bacterium]|nr:DNA polymerase III subunit delta' [Anaerolineae bacterium]